MAFIPTEVLHELGLNLSQLSSRDPERRRLVEQTATLFRCSQKTIYRQLAKLQILHACSRKDQGRPRHTIEADYKHWVEIVAALKLATRNQKGRHLSTAAAISLAEEGVSLDGRFEQIPKGVLTRSSCDRWMRQLGINIKSSIRQTPSIRFEAQASNECWQFDISVSDAHHLAEQRVLPEAGRSGYPHLGLFSVVDDHSRVNYQEYHLVYGEEVEAALLFLFRAMSEKDDPAFPFQGIPKALYMDNGPLSKSGVFRRVIAEKLGVEIKTHDTPAKGGLRQTPARSKGKVERCFRSVKESFETLFRFHQPETIKEANEWLITHLVHYNCQQHPTREGSRLEVWVAGCPVEGIRRVCSWETYAMFAREPEIRTVSKDRRVTIERQSYLVTEELIGERVEVWRGVFDSAIYVKDKAGTTHGPYEPESGPIAFGTFRGRRKTEQDRRLEKVEQMAEVLSIPREAMSHDRRSDEQRHQVYEVRTIPFTPPIGMDPERFVTPKEARRAIFERFGIPLAELPEEVLDQINALLAETLNRREVYRLVEQLIASREIGGWR